MLVALIVGGALAVGAVWLLWILRRPLGSRVLKGLLEKRKREREHCPASEDGKHRPGPRAARMPMPRVPGARRQWREKRRCWRCGQMLVSLRGGGLSFANARRSTPKAASHE